MKKSKYSQTAAALKYDKDKNKAPLLTAKGKGRVAEEIIKKAKDANIPIKEDPDLIEMLYKLDFYEEIPYELYDAVAEVLAFVYRMNKKVGNDETF